MVKLVILIEPLDDWDGFTTGWPEFLHHAEAMPGLRREASSQVDNHLFGSYKVSWMHELFFDSLQDAQRAMAAPAGQAAGRLLQQLTGGRMTLYFADHKEDDLDNIHHYRANNGIA